MIDGVIINKLKQIIDERGKVMHMLRSDAHFFEQFGEIYFSTVKPKVIKAWKLHLEMTLNIAVPIGEIKIVLYDNRDWSPTKGEIQELYVGQNNYCLVKVPPMIWNGFQGLASMESIVANCTSIPHDPNEVMRKDINDNFIPYKWE